MSGISGAGAVRKSGEVGKFPADHMIFIGSHVITSTGASTTGNSWTNTGLLYTVPSATAAKFSKIAIHWHNNFRINEGSGGTHSFLYTALQRIEPGTSISLTSATTDHRIGTQNHGGMDVFADWTGNHIDTALGSGDHTYKIQFNKGSNTYTNTVLHLGESNAKNHMILYGIV